MARWDLAVASVNRGVIEQAMSRFDDAMADFDRAVQLNPGLAEAYLNRGSLLDGEHKLDQAIADFTQALTLNPERPEQVYYNRAIAYEDRGDVRAAYFDYREASRLAPNWDKPKQELARFTVHRREAMG